MTHAFRNIVEEVSKRTKDVTEKISHLKIEMTQTVDRFNEYCKEYDSLKENQLYYRKEIQELIQLLNEKLTSHYGKTIEVKPLCEYIEVKDEKWRNALEGYLIVKDLI